MTTKDYPPFLGYKDQTKYTQAIDRIAQALMDKRAQFLFGAGMSRGSGLPLGGLLAETLLREFFLDASITDVRLKQLAAEFPFEAIVHAVENKPGCKRDDLTKALKALLVDPNPEINEAHRLFRSLLGVPPRLKAIFTTNYDTLLEQALGPNFSTPITEENAGSEIEKTRELGKIPIIHLRGTLDGPYQITEPEIGSNQYNILKEEFRIALHSSDAFIFVGFSLNDFDFRQIYLEFLEQMKLRKPSGKDTYFVSPATDQFTYVLGSAIWELRKAIWLPLDAETFFVKLTDAVENRALRSVREEVKKKYGANETELADLIDRTARMWRLDKEDALLFLYEARTQIGGKK